MLTLFDRLRTAVAAFSGRAPIGPVQKGGSAGWDHLIVSGSNNTKITNPMGQSPWVMRAIKTISGNITSVPLVWTAPGSGSQNNRITDPELAAFWAAPTRNGGGPMSLTDTIEAAVGWLKLAGEAFFILGDDWLLPFPEVKPNQSSPVVLARPDRMTPICQSGTLEGWRFLDGSRKSHSLLPQQVVQIKSYNPLDEIRGLSEWDTISTAAETDHLAGRFQKNLMQANGDQGLVVVAKDGAQLTDEQRTQIIEQLRFKKREQAAGRFCPVFLTGDIKLEDPKIRAVDAAFIDSRIKDRHLIYIALGVPPSMADITASYSVGSASDRYRLLTDTCIPIGGKIIEAFDKIESRRTGRAIKSAWDWSSHHTMIQVRNERTDVALKLFGMGVPVAQLNTVLDLGLRQFPGWETSYLPMGIVPSDQLGTDLPPAQDPAFAEQSKAADHFVAANKKVAAPNSILRTLAAARARAQCNGVAKAQSSSSLTLWSHHMRQRKPIIRAYENTIRRALIKARAETLKNLANHESQKSITRAGAAADIVFDLANFTTLLKVGMRKVATNAIETAGAQLYTELGKDDAFTYPAEAVLEFVHSRENKITDASEEIFRKIKNTLDDGFTSGKPTKDIAADVRAAFNGIAQGRAKTIAQTETGAAYGAGRQVAMESAGVKYKKWLTSGNDNVRPGHNAAEGQTVPVDEPFVIAGEQLMHPSDTNGSPENVINCHCVALALNAKESDSTDPGEPIA